MIPGEKVFAPERAVPWMWWAPCLVGGLARVWLMHSQEIHRVHRFSGRA